MRATCSNTPNVDAQRGQSSMFLSPLSTPKRVTTSAPDRVVDCSPGCSQTVPAWNSTTPSTGSRSGAGSSLPRSVSRCRRYCSRAQPVEAPPVRELPAPTSAGQRVLLLRKQSPLRRTRATSVHPREGCGFVSNGDKPRIGDEPREPSSLFERNAAVSVSMHHQCACRDLTR